MSGKGNECKPLPIGAAHWELLLRARAVETQSYVIAAAQCGDHSEKRQSYGHAIIIDPWGTVLAKLEDPEGGVGIAAGAYTRPLFSST